MDEASMILRVRARRKGNSVFLRSLTIMTLNE